MQSGCPVCEQVHPRASCPGNAGYLLEAWPEKHMLTAYCQWCHKMAGVAGEVLRGNKALVAPTVVIRPLCVWMDRHAGNPDGTARSVLAVTVGSMQAWADNLMLGNVVVQQAFVAASSSEQFYLLHQSPSVLMDYEAKRMVVLTSPLWS